MGCNCRNKPPKYVDPNCMEPIEWDEAKNLVGLTTCGDIVPVEKPEYELDAEDRRKLDTLDVDGDGTSALYNDGTYKPTYTQAESDQRLTQAISNAVEDAVMYTDEDNINPRRNVVLENGNSLYGKTTNGNVHTVAQVSSGNEVVIGSRDLPLELKSLTRPEVETFTGTGFTTEQMAYRSEVDAVTDQVGQVQENVDALQAEVGSLENRVTEAEAGIQTNRTSISDLQRSTEAGFDTMNGALTGLEDRVTANTSGIEANTSDIGQIRDELNQQEHFRGYFESTDDITDIANPREGDYAYNAETGTKWIYNGTTWLNSNVPVPDQTVDASDSIPLMDNEEGAAGTSNRYARGDHRHPSDDSKADKTALNDYLPLAGNTQTSRMTGDVWISSGQRVRLTNSGNSSIGQNGETNTTEMIGNGVGGIDLITANGTVKANGQEVVAYNANDDIIAKNNIQLKNHGELTGIDPEGVGHNLAMVSRYGIADYGSATLPLNLTSSVRPTIQLSGETGAEAHEIAFVSDVTDAASGLQDQIDANSNAIASNSTRIDKNEMDIESIQASLDEQDHFRGYYATTNEVTAIANPSAGDYAYNAETGTKWAYNGTTWVNTGDAVPDQTVDAYDGLPLVDGEANAGSVNQYSRGNHRHPTDPSRAAAADLLQTQNALSDLSDEFDSYKLENDSAVSTLESGVASNSGRITTLTGRVSNAESSISTLQTQAEAFGETQNDHTVAIADLDGRVSVAENDIQTLESRITNQETFKGYYATTDEITAIPGTPGDYAWNGETGTVWAYNGNSWANTGNVIPTGAVMPSDALPLIDGVAQAGESTNYSREDHRHPTDETRAALSDIPTAVSQLSNDVGYITDEDIPDVSGYLPLTGGTLTGTLTVNSTIVSSNSVISGHDVCSGSKSGPYDGKVGSVLNEDGGVSICHSDTPYLDFYYGLATRRTSRIIENTPGTINIQNSGGLNINGVRAATVNDIPAGGNSGREIIQISKEDFGVIRDADGIVRFSELSILDDNRPALQRLISSYENGATAPLDAIFVFDANDLGHENAIKTILSSKILASEYYEGNVGNTLIFSTFSFAPFIDFVGGWIFGLLIFEGILSDSSFVFPIESILGLSAYSIEKAAVNEAVSKAWSLHKLHK